MAFISHEDLNWLLKRCNQIVNTYKGSKSAGEIEPFNARVTEIGLRVQGQIKAATSFEDIAEARRIAFIELTKELEKRFQNFLDKPKNKGLDYKDLAKSSKSDFAKMVGSTLGAIYSDYPSVASDLSRPEIGVSHSLQSLSRPQLVSAFPPKGLPKESEYKLDNSPRVDMTSMVKAAHETSKAQLEKEEWRTRLERQEQQKQQQKQAAESKKVEQQAGLTTLKDAAKAEFKAFYEAVDGLKGKVVDKSVQAKKGAEYKTGKADKVHDLNGILRALRETHGGGGDIDLVALKRDVNAFRTDAAYKSVMIADSFLKGGLGMASKVGKAFKEFEDKVDVLIAKKKELDAHL